MYRLDLLCFEPPFRFTAADMRRYASGVGAIVTIAEVCAAVVGFALFNLNRRGTRTWVYVTTLDVDPASRRQGVARLLMAESERRAAVAGATLARLHVATDNVGAIRFYEASGYTRINLQEDFYGPERDAWVYAKKFLGGAGLPEEEL